MSIEGDFKELKEKVETANADLKSQRQAYENELKQLADDAISKLKQRIDDSEDHLKDRIEYFIGEEISRRATEVESSLKNELKKTYLPIFYGTAVVALALLLVWVSGQIKDVNSNVSSLYKDTIAARKEIEQSREKLERQSGELAKAQQDSEQSRDRLNTQTGKLEESQKRVDALETQLEKIRDQSAIELQRIQAMPNPTPK